MIKDIRDNLQRVIQDARALLSKEFGEQLEGIYSIVSDGILPKQPGAHLDEEGRVLRRKLVAAIAHKRAAE